MRRLVWVVIALVFTAGLALGSAAARGNEALRYPVTELWPRPSLWYSTLGSSGAQQVYLVVRDQNANPVAQAAVLLTAHFPNGDRTVVMPQTDENGVSRVTLLYENEPPGNMVSLEFWVVFGELPASTRDSFRIWW